MTKRLHWFLGVLLGAFLVTVVVPPWHALAAALSEGYQADETLAPGTLVAQSGDNRNRVVAADSDHTEALVGIVVATGSSTIEVVGPESSLQVATSGTATAIVSDIAGPVKAGDAITASPIKGVGMKALEPGRSVGVAKTDAASAGSQVATITSKGGESKTVQIMQVPVVINVGFFSPPSEKIPYPEFVQNFVNTIAGKSVAVVRVLIAGAILLIAILIAAFMLFAAIRSSLLSIGRNPLAKPAIYRALWQVIATVTVMLVVAVGIAYLLIRL